MTPGADYCASSMSFTSVPDLVTCAYDDASTDPSPSPPLVSGATSTAAFFIPITSKPSLRSSTPSNSPTSHKSSKTTDDRDARITHKTRRPSRICASWVPADGPSNRIPLTTPQRRRAQNRASQRAFRERKEKHVQHLEHELEELEKKHRDLAKSYTDLDSTHGKLKWEAKQLKAELESLKSSRESSIASMKQEDYFDPFASDTFFGTGTAMGF